MRPLYRVVVTRQAQADIRGAFQYIHKRAPLNAERWLWRLYSQLDTLEQFPERCAYARERLYLDEDLRQLIFHSHRIVFQVDKPSLAVYVLYVRHARQRAAGEPEGEE